VPLFAAVLLGNACSSNSTSPTDGGADGQANPGSGGTAGSAGQGGSGGSGGTAGAGGSGGLGGSGGNSGAGSGGTGGAGGSGGSGVDSGAGSGGTGGAGGSGGSGIDSGTTAATCSWDPTSNAGTFTEFYFSQGTSKTGNYYETACGYYGTETTTNGYSSVDQVLNIANSGAAQNTYFAAFPGAGTSWTVGNCGACIEFTGSNGSKVIATIIDECPTGSNPKCSETNHLDLSTSLFGATMVNQGQGNTGGDPGGGSWSFIACPITTDIMIRFNNEYAGQIYIQNTVYPVKAATANGTVLTQSPYGYWGGSLNNLGGTTLVLTDVEGHVVSGTVPSSDNTTGASLGVQFPSPGTCSL
jgi:hypothetical protein